MDAAGQARVRSARLAVAVARDARRVVDVENRRWCCRKSGRIFSDRAGDHLAEIGNLYILPDYRPGWLEALAEVADRAMTSLRVPSAWVRPLSMMAMWSQRRSPSSM